MRPDDASRSPPEPERELPETVAALRADGHPLPGAVERERARVERLVVRARRHAWLGYLNEVVDLIERRRNLDRTLDDAVVVPLPATIERVGSALRELRGSELLTGGRGRAPLDLGAVARLAVAAGDLLLDAGLELLELNPVVAYEDGAIALDAVARTSAPAPHPAAVSQ